MGLESRKQLKDQEDLTNTTLRHHHELLDLIARELDIESRRKSFFTLILNNFLEHQIMDIELILKDVQPACIGRVIFSLYLN